MKRHADATKKTAAQPTNEIEQSLRAIYQSPEGEFPDLTKLERQRGRRWIWLTLAVSGIFLILAAAAWTGFAYFQGLSGLGGDGLAVGIEGPEEISLGQEVTYFINYRNPLHEPLSAVDMRVNFPSDFILTQSTPQPTDKGVWKVGSLAAEESGTITLRGKFLGAIGAMSAIQVMATYRPSGNSGDLEAITAKSVKYTKSVIEGWMQVPEKAVPGDHVALLYHLTNTGRDNMDGLEARITLPDGFTPDQAAAGQFEAQGRILKKKAVAMAAGSSTEISVIGVFASGYGGDAKVMGQIGTLGQDGTFLPSQKSEAAFPVLAGDLSLKMVVNGTEQLERSVQFGDLLQASLDYENTSDEPLKNVKIQLAADTVSLGQEPAVLAGVSLVDLDAAMKNSSSSRDGNRLVWDVKNQPALKELAAHAQSTLEVPLQITSNATGTLPLAIRLTVTAEMEVGKIKRTIQMAPMVFKLRTDAKFGGQARYYTEEGAPVGSGPLPPKVGQATGYRVVWSLDKSIHALKDMEVAAVLPRNVRFMSLATTTAGALAYDADKREVKWSLNRLPANVNQAEVEFDVELTPTLADDGRFAQLMGEATFQAQDEDINEPLLQTIKPLTTDLKNDEGAKGKGVVRKDVK